MELRKFKLGDFAELITKGTTPTTIGAKFEKQGINFVKSESIGDGKFLNSEIFEHISVVTHNKLKRSQLKKNDLLFSIAGAYLGKIAVVQEKDLPLNTNQAVGIVRLKQNIDVEYVYYFYNLPQINSYINKLSSQSAQPNLSLELLNNLPIFLPDQKTQQSVSKVLSSLDSKIALNRSINRNLAIAA